MRNNLTMGALRDGVFIMLFLLLNSDFFFRPRYDIVDSPTNRDEFEDCSERREISLFVVFDFFVTGSKGGPIVNWSVLVIFFDAKGFGSDVSSFSTCFATCDKFLSRFSLLASLLR